MTGVAPKRTKRKTVAQRRGSRLDPVEVELSLNSACDDLLNGRGIPARTGEPLVDLLNWHGISPDKCDEFRARLVDVLCDYHADVLTSSPSPQQVDRELDELSRLANALARALAQLTDPAYQRLSLVAHGDMAIREGDVVQLDGPNAPSILGSLREQLTTLGSSVKVDQHYRRNREKDGGGRPEGKSEGALYVGLARLYKDMTGRTAGTGKQGGKHYVGPFIRFVEDCLTLMNLPMPSNRTLGRSLTDTAKVVARSARSKPQGPALPRRNDLGAAISAAAKQSPKRSKS